MVKILKKNTNQELLIKQIAAGANHVLAVTSTGQVYAWGDNEFGQLGLGRLLGTESSYIETPTQLKDLLDKKIIMTAAGRSHTLFLSDLG